MVVLIKERKVIHLDSLTGQPKRSLVSSIMELLCYVHVATYNAPLNISEWFALNPNEIIPLQRNCDDCGVFLCKYAEYIALERKIDFDQKDMPYFRRMIKKALQDGHL
ncbi:sentrin-specific protease 2-like [Actinia tenebrosa]|uniref:Sentrin-specific protease 2-like n=1 Tax=Actinia tenebrosa TaxID=6105 RepID=A0A6P8JBR7_ACTTE|nr:sentrin-specific protease 2-like [Actinia tenebrosa]